VSTIILKIDFKRQRVTLGDNVYTQSCEKEFNVYELIGTASHPFDRLHEQLRAFCDDHKCNLQQLMKLMAYTPVIRIIHFTGEMRLPRYLAIMLQRLFVNANACVPSGSTIKKTREYIEYLAQRMPTVGSTLTAHQRDRFKYHLPANEELEAMSIEMIDEELRLCDRSRGKYKKDNLSILSDHRKRLIHERNAEREALPKNKRKSDLSVFMDEIKIMKDERKRDEKRHKENKES